VCLPEEILSRSSSSSGQVFHVVIGFGISPQDIKVHVLCGAVSPTHSLGSLLFLSLGSLLFRISGGR